MDETDKNIEDCKIMKLIQELKDAKGNGNSLVSIIVPPRDEDLSLIDSRLDKDFKIVSKTKSNNRESALRAIISAHHKLDTYGKKVPPNGLVIYTGNVGEKDEVQIGFEPFEPMHASLCQLDSKFNLEALKTLLEYEKNYIHENHQYVAIWKLKKLIKALEDGQGNERSLISLIVPPQYEISQVINMLDDGFGTASSIKMSAIRAITSAQQRLKLYSKVPPNGLVIYCGTVVTEGGIEKEVRINYEPFKPINDALCLLDNKFHTEGLTRLLEPENKYGFIVMVGKKALFGIVSGNQKEVLCEFTANMIEMVRRAKKVYINPATRKPNVSAVVVAVSPVYKKDVSDRIGHRIPIMCEVEVSYGGMEGFNTAIERSSNYLYNVRFIQEICLLNKLMKEISQGTDKYVIGLEDTLRCLDKGAVKILIVWENLDLSRYVLKNTITNEVTTVHLNKEQENDESNFRDTATNEELEVQEKKSLLEWFTEEYMTFGCTLEFVTDSSHKGSIFCRGLCGIGGILKYKVDIQSSDNFSDAGDQLDVQSFSDLSIDLENDA